MHEPVPTSGPPVLYRCHARGEISEVDLRCARWGEPMHAGDIDALPGAVQRRG
ncbi:hypothetical protein [Nocardia sp. JCM 34519]|nr:hypothetical protein [Nocardia sp. JCM 34519]